MHFGMVWLAEISSQVRSLKNQQHSSSKLIRREVKQVKVCNIVTCPVAAGEIAIRQPHVRPDFRHCRIKKINGARLIRTFTGKVPRFQSTRRQVRHHIVRWCELNPARLPRDAGTVVLDLDHVWDPQSLLGR
jgi:hypothetical protein